MRVCVWVYRCVCRVRSNYDVNNASVCVLPVSRGLEVRASGKVEYPLGAALFAFI